MMEDLLRSRLHRVLEPLEQQINPDSMHVYLALLNTGPKTSTPKLQKTLEINHVYITQPKIRKNLRRLQEEGIILTRFQLGGRDLRYYAINPIILIELAFILHGHTSREYAQIQVEQPNSRKYIENLKKEAKKTWSNNQFNIGAFIEKDDKIRDILTFTTSLGPLYLFGWLDSLRDKLKGEDLWFFTPNLTFLGSREDKSYLKNFFVNIFTNLECNCHFFINPGSGDFNFSGIENIFPKLPIGPIYHWYEIRPSMFPTYYRINVFGEYLGAIFIKINERYYGELFDDDVKKINELIQSLKDLREISTNRK